MHGLEFPTVKPQLLNIQAIFKLVELDEPAVTKHDASALSCNHLWWKYQRREKNARVDTIEREMKKNGY
jgi:hypothetical protein